MVDVVDQYYIKGVLSKYFKNLSNESKDGLSESVKNLINYINSKMMFEKNNFRNRLVLNDNLDIKALGEIFVIQEKDGSPEYVTKLDKEIIINKVDEYVINLVPNWIDIVPDKREKGDAKTILLFNNETLNIRDNKHDNKHKNTLINNYLTRTIGNYRECVHWVNNTIKYKNEYIKYDDNKKFKINQMVIYQGERHIVSKIDRGKITFIKNRREYTVDKDDVWHFDPIYDDNKSFLDHILNQSQLGSERLPFYSFYTLDWVSQLKVFFAAEKQVSVVTAATGTGKSTNIPCVFWRYMVMKKKNTRLTLSQPRNKPTIDTSNTIRSWTGISYREKEQLHIQHYTKKASSLVESRVDDKKTSLLVQTDGALYSKFNKEENAYNYDMYMIDESHEHNINMDMILTILPNNNNFRKGNKKLVIISATLDRDESRYTHFYKNQKGLSFKRIHVNEPGKTTLFKISDIFLDKNVFNDSDNNITKYEKVKNAAVDKVIELCGEIDQFEKNKDILMFLPKTKDILKVCNEIVHKVPSYFSIIPYYSKLDISIKNLIDVPVEDIDKGSTDFESIIYNNKKGDYKHKIVIATNAAEASITIKTLFYVVDTGFSNTTVYDEQLMKSYSEILPITEESRKQRRGRVGRQNSGIVYYMYTPNLTKDTKIQYPLCVQELETHFVTLLKLGWSIDNLFDYNGTNFLIHPEENNDTYSRNLLNNMYNKIQSNRIKNCIIKLKIYKVIEVNDIPNLNLISKILTNKFCKKLEECDEDMTINFCDKLALYLSDINNCGIELFYTIQLVKNYEKIIKSLKNKVKPNLLNFHSFGLYFQMFRLYEYCHKNDINIHLITKFSQHIKKEFFCIENYKNMMKVVYKCNNYENTMFKNYVINTYTFNPIIYNKIKKFKIKFRNNEEYPSDKFIYENIEKENDILYIGGLTSVGI